MKKDILFIPCLLNGGFKNKRTGAKSTKAPNLLNKYPNTNICQIKLKDNKLKCLCEVRINIYGVLAPGI